MPEEPEVVDTVKVDTPDETKADITPPEEDTGADDKLIFDKYKDINAAGEAYKSAEAKISEQGKELSETKGELERLKQQSDLSKTLGAINETLKPKEPVVDWEAEKLRLIEEAQDDPGKAIIRALELSSGWSKADQDALKKQLEAQKVETQTLIAEMQKSNKQLNPEYIANKELADELVEGGMDIDKATAMAGVLNARMAPQTPDRATPPTSVNGDRVPVKDEPKAKFYTDKEREDFKAQGLLTDEDMDEREAEYATEQQKAGV